MRQSATLLIALALVACGRGSQAQPTGAATAAASQELAIDQVTPREPDVSVGLGSPAIGADGVFAKAFRGGAGSPPVSWTQVAGAASYVVVLEDPDAPQAAPFVHWMVWNIPADARALPPGLPDVGRVAAPPGAVQGRNDFGAFGYGGPSPPAGTGLHHYHLELFALDAPLPLSGDEGVRDLVAAMQGHVIADGELVGMAEAE